MGGGRERTTVYKIPMPFSKTPTAIAFLRPKAMPILGVRAIPAENEPRVMENIAALCSGGVTSATAARVTTTGEMIPLMSSTG